jgi:hypothetical protein
VDNAAVPPTQDQGESFSADEIRTLLAKAKKGDETTVPALRRLFGERNEYLRAFDVADLAKEAILNPMAGKNVAARELLSLRMAQVAEELSGPDPTPIERLLAERAAFCWHLVNAYERNYALADGLSIKQADYHQRRIDAAHKRYLSALKTLATVRKLAVPVLQVNIARKQVNVAGPLSVAGGGSEG